MYGAVFAASDAMSGALFGVVTDFGADGGERIILEENLTCFHELMLFEELDYLRNWCMNWAAFLTHGLFAVEAAFSFGNDVQRHRVYPPDCDSALIISLGKMGNGGRVIRVELSPNGSRPKRP